MVNEYFAYEGKGLFLARSDVDAHVHADGNHKRLPGLVCMDEDDIKYGGIELLAVHSVSEKPGVMYYVGDDYKHAVAVAKAVLPGCTSFYIDRNPLRIATMSSPINHKD